MASKKFTLYSTTKTQIAKEIGSCEKCSDKKSLEVHHIKKVSDSGGHTVSNLLVLCHTCHKDKAHRGAFSATEQRKIARNRSQRRKNAIQVILNKAKARQKPKKTKSEPKKPKPTRRRRPKSPLYQPYKLPKVEIPKVDFP